MRYLLLLLLVGGMVAGCGGGELACPECGYEGGLEHGHGYGGTGAVLSMYETEIPVRPAESGRECVIEVSDGGKEIFSIEANGDILLRGELIGTDKEVADTIAAEFDYLFGEMDRIGDHLSGASQ